MIEKKDIASMVKHVERRSQGVSDSHIMHPTREWIIGVVCVGLMVISGVALDIATFHAYKTSFATSVSVIETAVPYRAALVSNALHTYQLERETYELIRGGTVGTPGGVVLHATTNTNVASTSIPIMTMTASTTPVKNTTATIEATTTSEVKETVVLPIVKEKPVSPQPAN